MRSSTAGSGPVPVSLTATSTLPGRRQPDLAQILVRVGLHRLRELVEHVQCLVQPASLMTRRRAFQNPSAPSPMATCGATTKPLAFKSTSSSFLPFRMSVAPCRSQRDHTTPFHALFRDEECRSRTDNSSQLRDQPTHGPHRARKALGKDSTRLQAKSRFTGRRIAHEPCRRVISFTRFPCSRSQFAPDARQPWLLFVWRAVGAVIVG
jgi:hypothetical protein